MELNRLQLCNPAVIFPPRPCAVSGCDPKKKNVVYVGSKQPQQHRNRVAFSGKKGVVGLCGVPQEGAQKSPKTPSSTGTEQDKLQQAKYILTMDEG